MLDLIQAAGMLFLFSAAAGAVALWLPPLLASAILVGCSGIALHRLASRERTRSSMRLYAPAAQAIPWLGLASLLVAVIAPSLAILNFRIFGALPERADPTADLLQSPRGWIAFTALSIIVAPLAEEVVFRGWLLERLRLRFGWSSALVGTSLLFAVFHGTPWRTPYFFVIGGIFGGAVLVTRSVWAGIVLHTSYNASLLLVATRHPTRESLAQWAELHLGPAAAGVSVTTCLVALGLVAMRVNRIPIPLPLSRSAAGRSPR